MRSFLKNMTLCFFGCIFLAGCAGSSKQDVPQTYLLDSKHIKLNPVVHSHKKAQNGVLLLMPVQILTQYNSESFVYRHGQHTYSRDYYHRFLIPPAQQIHQLLEDSLIHSGLFREVQNSALSESTALLSVVVTDWYIDAQPQKQPVAVVSLRCRYYHLKGEIRSLRFQKEISVRVPVSKYGELAQAILLADEKALRVIFLMLEQTIAKKGGA